MKTANNKATNNATQSENPADRDIKPRRSVEAHAGPEENRPDQRLGDDADAGVGVPRRVLPAVERRSVFQPSAGEEWTADEVRQPQDLAKIAAGRENEVVAAPRAGVERAQ